MAKQKPGTLPAVFHAFILNGQRAYNFQNSAPTTCRSASSAMFVSIYRNKSAV